MNFARIHRASSIAALFLLAAAAMIALVAGCSPGKRVLVGDIPPETVITVSSVMPDTLLGQNHRVRLAWFGSDPDGDVVAFDLRMVNELTPADSQWVRLNCATGDCNDSLFTLYAPNGFTRAHLDVRAVDNEGVVDPTPATQSFSFFNNLPVCTITSGPGVRDSSYASVSIAWNVDDRGGDLSKLSFRVYLDGNEASYDSVYSGGPTATFTVPTARFAQGNPPEWRSGMRTVSVQAVDDGGRVGPPASLSWYVRSPGIVTVPAGTKGRALLVDNSARTAPNDFTVDTLYANTMTRNLAPGTYSTLRLDVDNAFRTAADLAQTFRQFDAVIWYRGFDTFAATTLTAFQDSVYDYLRHGGRFYLEGLNMIEGPGLITIVTPPMLRVSFYDEFLNCSAQRKFFAAVVGDSSVAWGTRNQNDPLPPLFRSSVLADSMRMASPVSPGMRVFVPRDTNQVLFWAKPNATAPPIPENMAVIMSVRQPSGGRAVAVPLPIRQASPTYRSSSFILAKLLFDTTAGLYAP